MSDLVQRLRKAAVVQYQQSYAENPNADIESFMEAEAATEIERLRAEIAELRAEVKRLHKFAVQAEAVRDAWQQYCNGPKLKQGFEDHRTLYELSDLLNGDCIVCGTDPCDCEDRSEP